VKSKKTKKHFSISGAGTNLKVGGWGHRPGAKRLNKNNIFFGFFPSTFLALKVQLVVLVSAFVQFGQFLACYSSTHGTPCLAICKSGGHVPPMPHGVGATGQHYGIGAVVWVFTELFSCQFCGVL